MFVIRIKDLQVETILGVYDWEKKSKRPVIMNIEMHVTEGKAGKSDAIVDAVDYDKIEQSIMGLLDKASYNLIEKLVTDIGTLILSLDSRIAKVSVEADKPGALKKSRSVSIRAEFNR